MKFIPATLLLAPLGALGSLNCTTTAPLRLYCCPDSTSEAVYEYKTGSLVMLGCASDHTENGRWFWNYNGLYTPNSYKLEKCVLGNMAFKNTDVLPNCSVDDFVLNLTKGKTSPLDKCDPKCVTNNKKPANVYYGDDVPVWPKVPLGGNTV